MYLLILAFDNGAGLKISYGVLHTPEHVRTNVHDYRLSSYRSCQSVKTNKTDMQTNTVTFACLI